MDKKIAVILPCLNEELTIGKVIQDVLKYLPESSIYVIDNASDDNSVKEVQKFDGVNIIIEPKRGKGNVIKKAFSTIDADIFIMVDADATYDFCEIQNYLKVFIDKNMDYMNIARKYSDKDSFNPFRRFGNILLNAIIKMLFGPYSNDILSGFKIVSKKYVKEFDINTEGFEIETEMYFYARKNNYICGELSCNYYQRTKNSYSKLSVLKDSFCILKYIIKGIIK